jgi:hypothetical protein
MGLWLLMMLWLLACVSPVVGLRLVRIRVARVTGSTAARALARLLW